MVFFLFFLGFGFRCSSEVTSVRVDTPLRTNKQIRLRITGPNGRGGGGRRSGGEG